jgi:hypothetical protein
VSWVQFPLWPFKFNHLRPKNKINMRLAMFLRHFLRNAPFKLKTILLITGSISAYLRYDLHYSPKNSDEPLKTKTIFFIFDLINQTKKFTKEELVEREITIKEGLVFHAKSMTPLEDNKWIYIMNKNTDMYVETPKKGFINHASLGDTQEVICAGEMKTQEGRVSLLNEKSGHYRPKNRVKLVEENLKKSGTQFHSSYTYNNNSIFATDTIKEKNIDNHTTLVIVRGF